MLHQIGNFYYLVSEDKVEVGDHGIAFATGINGVGRGHYRFKNDGTPVGKINAICNGTTKVIQTNNPELIADGVPELKVAITSGDEKETVFAAMYCPCIHESAYATLSLHKTRKGAEIALEFHKKKALDDFNETYCHIEAPVEFGQFERWDIVEIEILD